MKKFILVAVVLATLFLPQALSAKADIYLATGVLTGKEDTKDALEELKTDFLVPYLLIWNA